MDRRGMPRAAVLFLVVGLGSATLQAQQWTAGAQLVDLSWSHFDVAGGCNEARGTSPGLSLYGGRGLGHGLSLVATVRTHFAWSSVQLVCALMPLPPGGAGTYVFPFGSNPLAHSFLATDLRLEYAPRLRWFAPMVALGGGSVFWAGAPAPYGLLAGGVGIRAPVGRVALIVEYQRLALPIDRVLQTWVLEPTSGLPVFESQTDLGGGRYWMWARLLALRFDFDVK